MNKLNKILVTCAALVAVGASVPSYAGNRAGAAKITLGAGYDYLSPKRKIDNAGVAYGALGYDFTDKWGIEALLGFMNTNSRRNVDHDKQVTGIIFALDGVYHFSPFHLIEPYVLAGPGISAFNPNGNDAHEEGNINAGVGAEVFLDKSIALKVEARDLYTIVGGKNDFFLNGGVTFLFDIC